MSLPAIPDIPPACQQFANALEHLTDVYTDLSILPGDSPERRAAVTANRDRLLQQIRQNEQALEDCLIAHGVLKPCTTTFSGIATLTTSHSHAAGPFSTKPGDISVPLCFSANRTGVIMTTMLTLVFGPYAVPGTASSNTITLTQTGGGSGSFDPSTGFMVMPLTLHFAQSLDNLLSVLDSDATFSLETPVADASLLSVADGSIILVGSTTFVGGFLDGHNGTLTLTGTIPPGCPD